ncbi:MAG: nickel pincer cofactor biosynthesis protein LarC, partial [Acidobacteria bacterium]|nr:nickel pincer cofactor biosynthesis protein LarC [Acidobacteriota bacterium]
MRVAYFDAFSGVSGDMTVGALIDAGADAHALIHGLEHLRLGATYKATKTIRYGITATKFDVLIGDQPADHVHDHHHHHDHDHTHDQPHDHSHRGLTQILELIDKARIPAPVKASASRVFQILGEAESSVHGIPIEKVHFHEVGAVDSIADIVGACYGLHLLKVDEVYSSPINVGSGTVKAAHGMLPVPAPATALLLKGKPIYVDGPAVELTTPTGAAILAALARGYGNMPSLSINSIGYGAGTKDFPNRANVLRITIGDKLDSVEAQTVLLLEANIDDSSPQVLGYTMDQLFRAGALDVTLTPVLMKKNRAGHILTVVAKQEDKDALSNLILRETTTLGLRISSAER